MKLEVGIGIRPHPEFITMDIDPKTKPDILGDIKNIPLQNESVDEILTIHVLEHVFWADVLWVMSEFNRILKPDGILGIETPDFEVAKSRDIGRLYDMYDAIYMDKAGDRRVALYNSDKVFDDVFKEGFGHLCVFDEKILGWFFECAGFKPERLKTNESQSLHNWIGTLFMQGIKKSEPKTSREIDNQIIYMMKGYKWIDKYVERYG